MNPVLMTTLRRHWPLVGAIGIFALFTLANQVFFEPAAKRYEAAVKRAGELGMALDINDAPALLPPRVFALVADNALPSKEAQELGNSGVLTARLIEDLTEVLSRQHIDVVATEPGPVTQQSHSVIVRAYLKVRCRYGAFIALFDDLVQSRMLVAVDRFTLQPQTGGMEVADLWVSRYVLKQDRTRR